MKKYLIIFTILILSASAILLFSCKKDKTPPLIFIKGNNPMTVILQSNFTDPGATADDNKDGPSITNKITATNNVPVDSKHNTTLAGSYTVTYTVTDNAGNTATAVRTVNVINSMLRFAVSSTSGNTIDYLVTKTDSIPQDSVSFPNYANIQDSVLTDSKVNNRIIFTSVCKGITSPTNLISLPGFLRIHGDVVTFTDQSHNKHLYINVNSQTLRKTDLLDTNEYAYQVIGIGQNSYSKCIIDTAYNNISDNFRITLKYTVYKLRKLITAGDLNCCKVWQDSLTHTWFGGVSSSPQYYKIANCTEIYSRQ